MMPPAKSKVVWAFSSLFDAIHLSQERGAKEKRVSQFSLLESSLEQMSSKPGQMIRKANVLLVWS